MIFFQMSHTDTYLNMVSISNSNYSELLVHDCKTNSYSRNWHKQVGIHHEENVMGPMLEDLKALAAWRRGGTLHLDIKCTVQS